MCCFFTCSTLGWGSLVAAAPALETRVNWQRERQPPCHWEGGAGRSHGGGGDHPLVASSPSSVDVDPATRAPDRSFDEETRRPTSCHRASLTGLAVKLPPNSRIVDSDPPSLSFMPPPPCQQAHVVTVRRDVSQCAEAGSWPSATSTRCTSSVSFVALSGRRLVSARGGHRAARTR